MIGKGQLRIDTVTFRDFITPSYGEHLFGGGRGNLCNRCIASLRLPILRTYPAVDSAIRTPRDQYIIPVSKPYLGKTNVKAGTIRINGKFENRLNRTG